jgi:hypothetical protein
MSVLGFTGDRRQVELAMDSFGLPELVERGDDPLGLQLGTRRAASDGDWDAEAAAQVREILVRSYAGEQVGQQAERTDVELYVYAMDLDGAVVGAIHFVVN